MLTKAFRKCHHTVEKKAMTANSLQLVPRAELSFLPNGHNEMQGTHRGNHKARKTIEKKNTEPEDTHSRRSAMKA